MDTFPLFSCPVLKLFVDENTDQLIDHIEKADFKNTNVPGSNIAYTSNDVRLLKKYPRIERILLKKFQDIAKNNFCYTTDFIITTSWIAKMDPGGFAQMHSHKNSFYSGVYYFDEYEEGCSSLELETPFRAFPDYQILPTEWNVMNSTSWKFEPEKNLLIFFPSYVPHCVGENKSNRTRYSLAFNIAPIGEYGQADSIYNVSWTK